jgi:hypothetical protein
VVVVRAEAGDRDAASRRREERTMSGPDGGKRSAQLERRGWRTEERKAHPKPLSDKIVHPRVLVDVAPVAKKGRPK